MPKAPNEQKGYPSWKTEAVRELNDRHHIEATAIAERIWMQFYVHRLGPKEAADRAKGLIEACRPEKTEKE
jgi:hypothetical protein